MFYVIIQAVILGFLQGFTEFLPISSTAHLILLPKMMHWQDFGLFFDIAIHLGSLVAIIFYFWKNKEFKKNISLIPIHKLLWFIIIATIPVGLSGLIFNKVIENNARSIKLISLTTIIFGLLLGIAYFYNKYKNRSLQIRSLTTKNVSLIGIAQAIAIIPGVSRSGIVLTAGLFLGFNIKFASQFSFLLSIPVIMLAGFKQCLDLFLSNNEVMINMPVLVSGFFSSMCSSLVLVFLFFKYINTIGILPFVFYRCFLGAVLLNLYR